MPSATAYVSSSVSLKRPKNASDSTKPSVKVVCRRRKCALAQKVVYATDLEAALDRSPRHVPLHLKTAMSPGRRQTIASTSVNNGTKPKANPHVLYPSLPLHPDQPDHFQSQQPGHNQ